MGVTDPVHMCLV